jgi:hypothetical protein
MAAAVLGRLIVEHQHTTSWVAPRCIDAALALWVMGYASLTHPTVGLEKTPRPEAAGPIRKSLFSSFSSEKEDSSFTRPD